MCSSSCPTNNHGSWGACVRSKNVKVAYCQSVAGKDYTRQRNWDRELNAYEVVRKEGIQPKGTRRWLVDDAKRRSDNAGVGYDAGVP